MDMFPLDVPWLTLLRSRAERSIPVWKTYETMFAAAADHAGPWVNDVRGPVEERRIFIEYFYLPGGTIEAAVLFLPAAGGPPGICHGGALGTALDEFLGTVNAHNNSGGFTLNLKVSYRQPVILSPNGTLLRISGTVTKVEGRKIWLAGEITAGTNPAKVFASAEALFYQARKEGKTEGDLTAPEDQHKMFGKLVVSLTGESLLQPIWPVPVRCPESEALTLLVEDPTLKHWKLSGSAPFANKKWKRIQGWRNIMMQNSKLGICCMASSKTGKFVLVAAISHRTMGPPASIHGGCLFTVLDSGFAFFMQSPAFPSDGKGYFTARISVDFIRMAPTDCCYRVDVEKLPPKDTDQTNRITMKATLRNFHDGTLHAKAIAVFARPKSRRARI